MIASPVYIPHFEPALPIGWSLTGPMPDELPGLSPLELEDERGRYQILMYDALTQQDGTFYQRKIEIIDHRIERYQKLGLRWPNRSSAIDLVDVARDLKCAVPLERFIADQLTMTRLERSGDTWKGRCPIPTHEDRTPSFVVYPDARWTCFGKCGKSGDIFTLIGLVYGLERFRDQVRVLADYFGKELS